MSKSEQISHMTDVMAKFVGYTGKVLPDDVTAKLEDLHKKETSKLADVIFTTMIENQRLAKSWIDLPARTPVSFSFWWSAGRTFR